MLRATREFGLGRDGKPQITGLFVLLNDLKGVGLEVAQGMTYVDSFYWDMDERSREFSKRFLAEHGAMPSFSQAADYSATIQYLKAIEAEGTDNADAVMKRLEIDRHFEDVFDIAAADLDPKPLPQVYDRFLKKHGVDPTRAAMFEDLARNLEVPHALGMTTVLVVPEKDKEVFREIWENAGRDAPHVDHVTDDLTMFLQVKCLRERAKSG